MSLKCQGAPFALPTRVPIGASASVVVASAEVAPVGSPGAAGDACTAREPAAVAVTAEEAGADAEVEGAFRPGRPERAASVRPQLGHSPLPPSSGAFQNLLQSSHHGNCATLHGHQGRPSRSWSHRSGSTGASEVWGVIGRTVRLRDGPRSFRRGTTSDVRSRPKHRPPLQPDRSPGDHARLASADLVRSGRSDCTRGHESACCAFSRQEVPLLRLLS
jgi:hypothetical protein